MGSKDITINNIAKKGISSVLLGVNVNDRLPNIVQLNEAFGVSRGTVQNVLNDLSENRAIKIESRGHMGSYLIKKDINKLLYAAGVNSIYFSMAIPYSKRGEALATGIYKETYKLDIPAGTFFISGSERRLKSLLEKRLDVALMSQRAAEKYMEDGYEIEFLHIFPDHSYITNHHLITRKGFEFNTADPIRLGLDPTSSDQNYFIQKLFKDRKVVSIPLQYIHAVERILDNTIDACIWSIEDKKKYPGIDMTELFYKDENGKRDLRNTRAAMVIRKNDIAIKNYLENSVDFNNIVHIQNMILNGKMLPEY